MERYPLPHGAKRIDIDDLAVRFGVDKIELLRKSDGGSHHTLHAGFNSGVIDVHEAVVDESGRKQYHTLFAIRRDDLPEALGELTSMVNELVRLIRPLRLGWLKHHDIGIVKGLDPLSDDEIAAITCKQKGRLVIDEKQWESNVFVPEYPEDVWAFPDGTFSLFYRGRKIGIGFKNTDPAGNVRLFWTKLRHLIRFGNFWQPKVIEALVRFSIPREKYGDYPFLRP